MHRATIAMHAGYVEQASALIFLTVIDAMPVFEWMPKTHILASIDPWNPIVLSVYKTYSPVPHPLSSWYSIVLFSFRLN
jgi:hypothetical protein